MVLFIHSLQSSFVVKDINILRKYFSIRNFHYKTSKNIFQNLHELVRQFLWLLTHINQSKIIFVWFADYHSFLPIFFAKILDKKSFLVLGGYDVTYIPEIKYGSFSNPLRAFCAEFSIKNATLCLPVSDNIEEEALMRVSSAKTKILYTGYSRNKFIPGINDKENIVLTVGIGTTHQRIKIKGIDFFIEVARSLPYYRFVIIGMNKKNLKSQLDIPKNVEIFDKMPQYELVKYYQEAKVYAQFSMREGLPNVVCESMLCECIPVGFDSGGIPIAIGNCGFILKEENIDKAVELVKKAMNSSPNLGKKARNRIISLFSLRRREKEMITTILQYLS